LPNSVPNATCWALRYFGTKYIGAFVLLSRVIGVGGELVDTEAAGTSISRKTLRSRRVATKASVERLNLIHGVDAFDLALDAADSKGASNLLEKMIAHGITVAHKKAMDLLERNKDRCDPVTRFDASTLRRG